MYRHLTNQESAEAITSVKSGPPILLYLASEDRAFVSHRLPMARAAKNAGFVVHIATNITKHAETISAEGFCLHQIPFRRGGLRPLSALLTILAIRKLERKMGPSVIHHSGLQCCVLGGIAALDHPARQINALTGLGYVFTSRSLKAQIIKKAVNLLLRFLLNRKTSIALVQNPDDATALEAMRISSQKIAMILGSGVDTNVLVPLSEPDGPITIGFAGRLLIDKGIRTLVTAHRILRNRGLDTRLLIAGEPDPANPESVSQAEAEAWNNDPGITWLGHISDIQDLWDRSHIAALPSHREGLPKSLLEAAAFGRPMVATDVPGCREIVIHEQTGLLVAVEDPQALADAIEKLAKSVVLRQRFGIAARQLVVEKMSVNSIGAAIVDLYRRSSS